MTAPARRRAAGGERERGSAIVLALLVAVILTLLGISFLWMAETEVRIAENEKLAAQALYVAEGGARVVKSWFDKPSVALHVPEMAEVDRTLRTIDLDGAGPGVPQAAGGGIPYYKEGVDADADGEDDLFLRPYRGGTEHALLGTPDGPDVRIDAGDPSSAPFLRELSIALASDLEGPLFRARIARIDVFGPPYVQDGAVWVRYGLGTIRVTVELRRGTEGGPEERVVAQRTVQAVLNEAPYPGPYGALHSCADIEWSDGLSVRWGAMTAILNSDLPADEDDYPESVPRSIPGTPALDSVWGGGWPQSLADWRSAVDGSAIEDPWFRVLVGGTMGLSVGGTNQQPFPSPWSTGAGGCCDHSNLFRRLYYVGCPVYDYDLWKSIAAAGDSHVRYYVWDSGTQYRENGRGAPQEFADITDGRTGIYFFDTADGLPPRDDDADARYDNLAPPIVVSGGTWSFRGFLFLNAESFRVSGATGRTAELRAPGEPFHDSSGPPDGAWQAGETWVNLAYDSANPYAAFVVDGSDNLQDPGGTGSGAVRNSTGPPLSASVHVEGILFTNGAFSSRGNGTYFGSVIARQGVSEAGGAAGRPDLFWDDRIRRGDWPPEGWTLPRVILTRWAADPGSP